LVYPTRRLWAALFSFLPYSLLLTSGPEETKQRYINQAKKKKKEVTRKETTRKEKNCASMMNRTNSAEKQSHISHCVLHLAKEKDKHISHFIQRITL